MKGHSFAFKPRWPQVAVVLVLLAAHGLILQFVSTHAGLSAAAMAVLFALVVLKHLGLLGSLSSRIRRRGRQ